MIKDMLKTAKIYLDRLSKAVKDIEELGNIEDINLDDFETIKNIDTFIFRFMKLQDYLGNKLFKVFLNEIGEYKENLLICLISWKR